MQTRPNAAVRLCINRKPAVARGGTALSLPPSLLFLAIMGIFDRFKADVVETTSRSTEPVSEKTPADDSSSIDATGNQLNSGDVQSGVKRIEATTSTWARKHLFIAYGL